MRISNLGYVCAASEYVNGFEERLNLAALRRPSSGIHCPELGLISAMLTRIGLTWQRFVLVR